jgi:hypothetical protein
MLAMERATEMFEVASGNIMDALTVEVLQVILYAQLYDGI